MTGHRVPERARRLVGVCAALVAVPVAFLIVFLTASAEAGSPVTAAPLPAAAALTDEPCDPEVTECPPEPTDAPTETTGTQPSEPGTQTSTTTTAPATTAPTTSSSSGGGGGGGTTSGPPTTTRPPSTTRPPAAAPVIAPPSVAPTVTATVRTTTSAAPAAPSAPSSEAAAANGRPSGLMLGSTAGILVALAVSLAFLVRERRLQRQERDERELEHWANYR